MVSSLTRSLQKNTILSCYYAMSVLRMCRKSDLQSGLVWFGKSFLPGTQYSGMLISRYLDIYVIVGVYGTLTTERV